VFQVQSKVLLLMALALMVLATCVTALLTYETRISSVGIVKTMVVGAFWDINCTRMVTEIDWELVEPGQHVNATIYLRNEGNAPITLLLDTENWSPSNALNYITLSWDYADQTVNSEAVIKITLILAVSSNVTEIANFGFDVVITGVG